MILACIGGLGAASSALAAAPEKPETIAGAVTGTSAVFEGVLNPHIKALVGGYFAYSNPGGLTCAEGPAVGLEGFEGEQEVQAQAVHALVGLEPNRKYKFCLVATNEGGAQATPGEEVEVVTPAIPPTIESESTAPVPASEGDPHPSPASEIRLEGVVNANNEPTECHFQYQLEEEHLLAPTTTLCEPNALAGTLGGQGVALNVGGLEAGKVYYYRVVAKNAAGETQGTETEPIKQFETALPPNTPEQA
jgi:hypothetical protein